MTDTHTTNTRRGFSLRDMALCSLFAAILAVSAWLTIPGEVPFTLQTFGVFAALGLFGRKARNHRPGPVSDFGCCGTSRVCRISRRIRRSAGHHRRIYLRFPAVRPFILGLDLCTWPTGLDPAAGHGGGTAPVLRCRNRLVYAGLFAANRSDRLERGFTQVRRPLSPAGRREIGHCLDSLPTLSPLCPVSRFFHFSAGFSLYISGKRC